MSTEKSKKRKVVTAITAVTAAAAIMLSGTYAWQSISQKVMNEVASVVNPGGRLHDDFDGENKDIYVENFGNDPTFARIRLSEYMETGKDAGVNKDDINRDATPVLEGTDINDLSTWTTHIPGDPHDAFHDEYWTWTMGGSTIFMPTFNKNKDSLEADVNGTFAGPDLDPETDDDRYDDYHAYADGETKEADAVYDNDANDIDEGDEAVNPDNITKVPETHTAKSTINGTVMTMAEWKENGSQPGNYWVYDTDGWAYWANPIAPGEATGLLLDKIELKQEMADWYYAINVEGQFATADDLGSKADGSGFFKDGMTDDAFLLLGGISGNSAVTVTAENGADTVLQNATLQLNAVFTMFGEKDDNPAVTWSVSGNTSDGTTINENGLLTVAAAELADSLTIKAVHNTYDGVIGKYTVSVDKINAVNISPETASVAKGGTQTFTAAVVTVSGQTLSDSPVTWSVTGGSDGTSISADGVLTVSEDETAETLTVQATSQYVDTVFGTADVTVKQPSVADLIGEIEPGSTDAVTIDDREWYMLAKEDGKALIWAKEQETTCGNRAFYKTFVANGNIWRDSEVRAWLNDETEEGYLVNLPTLKDSVVETDITTRSAVGATDWITTTDAVFLLSEADFNGTYSHKKTSDARDYTYGTSALVPNINMKNCGHKAPDYVSTAEYWLRSGLDADAYIAVYNIDVNRLAGNYFTDPGRGVRPAMWIDLSKLPTE